MVPNPIVLMQKERPPKAKARRNSTSTDLDWILHITNTILVAFLVTTHPWSRRWFYSGALAESLLLLYGLTAERRLLEDVSPWILLSSLNLAYVFAAGTWTTYLSFSAACWLLVIVTLLYQFNSISSFVRHRLRSVLKRQLFFRDRVALFDLPALALDVGISGLVVVRGLTLSFASMTIKAHGIELAFQIKDNVELLIFTDEVDIRLFREINIGAAYAILRNGKIRDACAEAKDAQMAFEGVTTMTDEEIEDRYNHARRDIYAEGSIFQSHPERSDLAKAEDGASLTQEERAALCSRLRDAKAVPHAPRQSIKVSTLLQYIPQWLRRLVLRLPFLIRAALMPLSQLHPASAASISFAVSGHWLTPGLDSKMAKEYAEKDPEIGKVQEGVREWLTDADFCLDGVEINGLAQVPFRKGMDVVTYLRCAELTAFRILEKGKAIEKVAQIGGADSTFVLPLFMLPGHDHLLPGKPEKGRQDGFHEDEDSEDETPDDKGNIVYSTHGLFPAVLDQDLLDFSAQLTNASKIMELEAEKEEAGHDDPPKSTIKKLPMYFKHPRQHMKTGAKKLMESDIVDTDWVAELLGKVASGLEKLKGEIGYSGSFGVDLGPYREGVDGRPKLWA